MIRQCALPPHTMTCDRCGASWRPSNARGREHPTASSLDREALQHWMDCKDQERQ